MGTVHWFKSAYSDSSGGACVEVAFRPGEVCIRDSSDSSGPTLAFPAGQWSAFLLHVLRDIPAHSRT